MHNYLFWLHETIMHNNLHRWYLWKVSRLMVKKNIYTTHISFLDMALFTLRVYIVQVLQLCRKQHKGHKRITMFSCSLRSSAYPQQRKNKILNSVWNQNWFSGNFYQKSLKFGSRNWEGISHFWDLNSQHLDKKTLLYPRTLLYIN